MWSTYLNKHFICIAILILIASTSSWAQQSPSTQEVWPEFKLFYSFNPHLRILGQYSATRLNRSYYAEGKAGFFVDYLNNFQGKHSITKADSLRERTLKIRAGYLFGVNPPDSSDSFREHTIVTQGDYYLPLKWGMETEIRNRFDWSINNGSFEPRYRPRLKFSKDFATEYLTFSSYIYGEYFWDFNDSNHNRWRLCVGSEFKVTRRSDFEVYYLYQFANQPDIGELSAIGLTLRIYIAVKHKEENRKD